MTTLHPSRIAAFLLFVLGLLPALRAADGQAVGTVPVAAGLSLADVKEAIVVSFTQRGWVVKEKTDNRVVGFLNHRGNEATLTMTFDTSTVSLFCEGWKVKNGTRVKPEIPNGWIGNLKKDITKRMNLASARK